MSKKVAWDRATANIFAICLACLPSLRVKRNNLIMRARMTLHLEDSAGQEQDGQATQARSKSLLKQRASAWNTQTLRMARTFCMVCACKADEEKCWKSRETMSVYFSGLFWFGRFGKLCFVPGQEQAVLTKLAAGCFWATFGVLEVFPGKGPCGRASRSQI